MEIMNTQKSFLLDLAIGKRWRIARHICLIVFFAILFYPNVDETMIKKLNVQNAEGIIAAFNKTSIILYFVSLFFIYLNFFLLIPRFLLKNKFSLYIICCAICVCIIFIVDVSVAKFCLKSLLEFVPVPTFSLKGFIDSALIPVVFLAATAGYQVFKKWITDSALLAELKQHKIEQELTNLKNQINPHFLFNTLNNLNTLITVDADKASAVVLGLSDVLRYQLYEANEEKVLLKKDIEILQQFLELEKIRRDNFQFSITTDGDIFSILIPPFIFINFVENAIKHSVDNTGFSFISAHFSVVKNILVFTCKNSKPSVIKAKVNGGLGLQNIKRRLELMYEEKFLLDIKDDKNEFMITLQLPI
jgi:sensor histidine kinase YesM